MGKPKYSGLALLQYSFYHSGLEPNLQYLGGMPVHGINWCILFFVFLKFYLIIQG